MLSCAAGLWTGWEVETRRPSNLGHYGPKELSHVLRQICRACLYPSTLAVQSMGIDLLEVPVVIHSMHDRSVFFLYTDCMSKSMQINHHMLCAVGL